MISHILKPILEISSAEPTIVNALLKISLASTIYKLYTTLYRWSSQTLPHRAMDGLKPSESKCKGRKSLTFCLMTGKIIYKKCNENRKENENPKQGFNYLVAAGKHFYVMRYKTCEIV